MDNKELAEKAVKETTLLAFAEAVTTALDFGYKTALKTAELKDEEYRDRIDNLAYEVQYWKNKYNDLFAQTTIKS